MSLCGAEWQANFAAGRVERTAVRARQSLGAAACRAGSSRAGRVGAPALGRRRLRLWRSVAERALAAPRCRRKALWQCRFQDHIGLSERRRHQACRTRGTPSRVMVPGCRGTILCSRATPAVHARSAGRKPTGHRHMRSATIDELVIAVSITDGGWTASQCHRNRVGREINGNFDEYVTFCRRCLREQRTVHSGDASANFTKIFFRRRGYASCGACRASRTGQSPAVRVAFPTCCCPARSIQVSPITSPG